ncbi:MAG: phosphatidylglycerophosphatase A [Candidatus Euphemobacter frigidus]|nr:phosphatidylglycerophosphatase A [Candidatus Euphemobacter frigidus]MDP8275145.1 phosphatidylglycerophosphatase A [Candidatus Euphemobacter frigidus]
MKIGRKYQGGWLVRLLASFFYLGYFPVAPGTLGAAGGLTLYLLLRFCVSGFVPESGDELRLGYLIFLALFFLIGVYLSTRGEKEWREKDHPRIVIDEAFSIFITFFFLPATPLILAGGFVLNRLFDIVKPFPVGWLEKLPGGWGVMLDDLMAGIYSNFALRLILLIFIKS